MEIFKSEERETAELLYELVDQVSDTLEKFQELIFSYLNDDEVYKEIAHSVHESEHEGDEIRREVERHIYNGSFLPVVREDYIMVAELTDKIADRAELCAEKIAQEKPFVPSEVRDDLRKLTREVRASYKPLIKLLRFDNSHEKSRIQEYIDKIASAEQRVDRIEWDLIDRFYQFEDLSNAQKIHLRELVNQIASVSDCVEDVSDRILILYTKEIF